MLNIININVTKIFLAYLLNLTVHIFLIFNYFYSNISFCSFIDRYQDFYIALQIIERYHICFLIFIRFLFH